MFSAQNKHGIEVRNPAEVRRAIAAGYTEGDVEPWVLKASSMDTALDLKKAEAFKACCYILHNTMGDNNTWIEKTYANKDSNKDRAMVCTRLKLDFSLMRSRVGVQRSEAAL